MDSIKKGIVGGALLFVLGLGIGFLNKKTDEKIVYKEKIVEVIKEVKETKKDTNLKTKTRTVKNIDGSEVIETETQIVSKEEELTKKEQTTEKTLDIEKKTVYNTGKWLVGVSALTDSDKLIKYQGELSKQFIGPFYLGLTASNKNEYGVTVKFNF